MKIRQFFRMTAGPVVALAAIVLAGTMNTPHRVQAQDNGNNDEEQLVHIGYAIAPQRVTSVNPDITGTHPGSTVRMSTEKAASRQEIKHSRDRRLAVLIRTIC